MWKWNDSDMCLVVKSTNKESQQFLVTTFSLRHKFFLRIRERECFISGYDIKTNLKPIPQA